MTFSINLFIFLLYVELSEEIERNNRVNVYNDCEQHHSEYQLFTVVRNRLKDSAQCFKTNSHIQ